MSNFRIMNYPLYQHHFQEIKRSLEYLVLATPTGEVRNVLTEMNTLLLIMESCIDDAQAGKKKI